jgi:hypothetical protein
VLQPGDDLEIVTNGSGSVWVCMSGSAMRQFAPLTVGTATSAQQAATYGQLLALVGSFGNIIGSNATQTFTNAITNGAIQYYGTTAAQVLTLPLWSTMVGKSTISFINTSTVPVTVSRQGTSDTIITVNNNGVASIVLQPGDDLELVVSGATGQYIARAGSALRQFSPLLVGTPNAAAAALNVAAQGHGKCQLTVTSATAIALTPHNGNNVIVNGIPLTLPSAGGTGSNTGLTASTVQYVYLAGTTASPSLVFSTTGHVTGTNGVEVMSGDATKTLVGMVYVNASGQFVPASAGNRLLCRSWFERIRRFDNITTATYTTTATALTELSSSARINFLCWADEAVQVFSVGEISNQTASASTTVTGYLDGASVTPAQAFTSPGSNFGAPYNVASIQTYSEAVLHFYTLYGSVSSGTGTVTVNQNLTLV